MGVDEMGVDEMGVDKMGSRQIGNHIYLHFFIFKLLYDLYLICKCTHTATIFFIWSNSKLLCSGMQ